MIDAYTKAILTVIALALVVLVARPYVAPPPTQAAGVTDVRIVDLGTFSAYRALPVKVVEGR